jgi:FlaA1/EpsC-like NDP-sugar epimerase
LQRGRNSFGIGALRHIERPVKKVLPYRRPLIVLAHAVLVAAAYALAFLLRFDFALPPRYAHLLLITLPALLVVRLTVFWALHLYEGLWRYIGTRDLRTILVAVSVSSIGFTVVMMVLFIYEGVSFPRSVLLLDWVLCTTLMLGSRILVREVKEARAQRGRERGQKILIVGAGEAGEKLLREIHHNDGINYDVAGFVDDDPSRQRLRIHGVPVLGTSSDVPRLCVENAVEELVLALPSVDGPARRQIVRHCLEARVPVKSVPSLTDLRSGRARIGQLGAVSPEDLLGRQAVEVDIERLIHEVSGKRVMVTGAAGSIGSELCRQLASLHPELIVMYDRAESPLYFTSVEVREKYPDLRLVPAVGDILDEAKVREVMGAYEPDVIYHAAAYKHVPLMEAQPLEAIQNNVFGTEVVARVAMDVGVPKFVLISTDKAVRPVGIMGMTKKVAEDLLIYLNNQTTTFVSVRFGNVLGSAGSVLPLFEAQIARGGPVTVTDPDATRYFMIIAEAAQLVLQAGAMGKGGEVFFLDMGEPVRIGDLADNVIRLSGHSPGRDVAVQTVGMRPGERLSEQLVRETEELTISEHEKIFLAHGSGRVDTDFGADFEALRDLLLQRDHSPAIDLLSKMAKR